MNARFSRKFPQCQLALPAWVAAEIPSSEHVYQTVEERMDLVIRLAESNIEHGGGPFGAAIFDMEAGTLVAPGVNLVVPSQCSIAHAEIVAIVIAQVLYQTYDLGAPDLPPSQLVTSTEPCAMCLGAIPWSGISSLVCGAEGADATDIGFDEGAKPSDWVAELEARGICVQRHVGRAQAIDVLEKYAVVGGRIYNGSSRKRLLEPEKWKPRRE